MRISFAGKAICIKDCQGPASYFRSMRVYYYFFYGGSSYCHGVSENYALNYGSDMGRLWLSENKFNEHFRHIDGQ